MESQLRQQREHELVRLLLGDRAGFREFCTQALQLSTAEMARQVDRDLIRAVLDREFPPFAVQWRLPRPKRLPH
jgi:hypothetical protein